MDKKQIIYAILAVSATFGLLYFVYTLTNKPQQVSFPTVNQLSSADHVKWSKNKKVILVEYSDLQCPACKFFHDEITKWEKGDKEVQQAMKNITFVYRHYPLTTIHQNSLQAAYAAEAASRQGKFFEMSDLLFTNQDSWAESEDPKKIFAEYAKQLKLNTDQFTKDMDSSGVKDRVNQNISSGNEVQVNSTPTFFLNGTKVQVASLDEFKKLLIDASKESEKSAS